MRKYWKAVVNLAVDLCIFLLVIFLLPRVILYFLPFVIGWVIALLAGPPVRFLEKKLKIRRKAGSAFMIVAGIALVVLLFYLLGTFLVEQVVGLLGALPQMWGDLEQDAAQIGENLNVIYERLPGDLKESISDITQQISSMMGDFLGKISTPTITALGNVAKQIPSWFISVIMCLLSAYLFVAEKDQISDWMHHHIPASLQEQFRIVRGGALHAVGGYLKAQLKIEVWMYLLLLIGLTVLRVSYAPLIALGIAFLDFWPIFGTGTVMIPWALLEILTGEYSMAIGLLLIWGIGQLARQMIQPKYVGDSIGVPPIPTLFLLFIGYKTGGVTGMIVAVPLGLVVYSLYEAGTFDTAQNSIRILVHGINRFRHLEPEDLDETPRKAPQTTQRKTPQSASQSTSKETPQSASQSTSKEAPQSASQSMSKKTP